MRHYIHYHCQSCSYCVAKAKASQPVGTAVTAGGDMATVESFKAASSVYAPLSGEIIEINDSLSDDPAQVNSEPLGAGWFVKIKLDDPSAADALMDEGAYKALIS